MRSPCTRSATPSGPSAAASIRSCATPRSWKRFRFEAASRSRGERVCAGHDLQDLLRDLGLAGAVHRQGQAVDQLPGILRRVSHRGHSGALLGGCRLEQRPEELGLDVDGQQALEDLLGLRLVDEVAGERLIAIVPGLEEALGDRKDLLLHDPLDERRYELVVDEDHAVDITLGVELADLVRDRLRIVVAGAVAETDPGLVDLVAPEAQARRSFASRDQPASLHTLSPEPAFDREDLPQDL